LSSRLHGGEDGEPNARAFEGAISLLDVRRESDYLRGHHPLAANIPLEELASRIHELPRPYEPLTIFDTSDVRAEKAAADLVARGREDIRIVHGEEWLHTGPVVSGPATVRLWRPHDLLIEALSSEPLADARGRAREGPSHGEAIAGGNARLRALDIACGTGRDAVHLALSGYDVDAIDVLPDAIDRCRDLARRNGVSVNAMVRDIERDIDLGDNAYDLICVFNFLHRPLMPAIVQAVRPGGRVVYETFLKGQRERFGKPRSDNHLLLPGELRSHFEGWGLLVDHEGLAGPRRWAASLIARKPHHGVG